MKRYFLLKAMLLLAVIASSQEIECENCGIGTTAPIATLEIKGCGNQGQTKVLSVTDGAGTSLLLINDNGNIGIGTNSPSSKLEVKTTATNDSPLLLTSPDGYVEIGVRNAGFAHFMTDRNKYYFDKEINTANGLSSWGTDLHLKTNGSIRISADKDNGNVGIGTVDATHTLTVNGDSKFEGKANFNSVINLPTILPHPTNKEVGDLYFDGYNLYIETLVGPKRITDQGL